MSLFDHDEQADIAAPFGVGWAPPGNGVRRGSGKALALRAELSARTPLVQMLTIALFEAGQLEVGSMGRKTRRERAQYWTEIFMRGTQVHADRSCSPPLKEHLNVRTFFKVVIWFMAAIVGLFVWNVTPDFRPVIGWVLAAAFVCYVLSAIVEATVKRLIADELLELRRQSNATASRIDVLDRKVTAILRDALEHRRAR